MSEQFGATPAQWLHFSKTLGLEADMLPVVSKPTAKISAQSTMKQLGKTPSRYNGSGEVVGIAKWTEHHATSSEVANWSARPDYGFCLQTRTVRAFDIDCEDSDTVVRIVEVINGVVNWLGFPLRYRNNSAKCLLIFKLPGVLPKRVIRMQNGIIEMLGTGQQFIACGTHPSGAKYEWQEPLAGTDALPENIPELTLEEVDAIWSALEAAFAVAPSTSATAPSKAKMLHAAIDSDPVAQHLIEIGSVLSIDRDGKLHITCPFEDGHSTASAVSSTTYFPANTGGYQFGHFACLHASCEHRTDQDFKDALEVPYDDPMNDFEDLTLSSGHQAGVESNSATPRETNETKGEKLELPGQKDKGLAKPRFTVVPADEFAQAHPQSWIIKGVLPDADTGVIYGESTAGKSFFVLDMIGAVARGVEWRGHKVKQGNAVYIVAEGAGGMRGRLTAYGNHSGVELCDLPIGIIADAPNFMEVTDVKSVLAAVRAFGKVSIIVVDTFAQVMAGANENSGEDVGKALKHCKALSKHTGALVLLIHHAGKDTSKGARGWSGLRAAADVEIEIARDGEERVATITKMKDGMDGAQYGFKLNIVSVGEDEDGDVLTSCTIEPADITRKVKVADSKNATENLALKAFEELIGVGEQRVMYAVLVSAMVNEMLYDTGSSKKDTRRDKAGDAVHKLIAEGKLVDKGGFISFPEGAGELA